MEYCQLQKDVLMKNNYYEEKVKILKALSNPVRLEIIDFLSNGEKCVCEIVENLQYEQPHISKRLIKFKEARLIRDRKEVLNVYYSLKICCLKDFFSCLNKILENSSK